MLSLAPPAIAEHPRSVTSGRAGVEERSRSGDDEAAKRPLELKTIS